MARPTKQQSLAAVSGTLVLVGAGKMGGAMLNGWLGRGLPPQPRANGKRPRNSTGYP